MLDRLTCAVVAVVLAGPVPAAASYWAICRVEADILDIAFSDEVGVLVHSSEVSPTEAATARASWRLARFICRTTPILRDWRAA